MRLKNIYLKDGKRHREVEITRYDGVKFQRAYIDSSTKVSLKAFREYIADTIDANFYGGEQDLLGVWDYAYRKSGDNLVFVPREMGELDNGRGWLFHDCFLRTDGLLVEPDEDNIMWVNGNTIGYKPSSNEVGATQQGDRGDSERGFKLKILGDEMDREQRDALLYGFIENLGRNLGS